VSASGAWLPERRHALFPLAARRLVAASALGVTEAATCCWRSGPPASRAPAAVHSPTSDGNALLERRLSKGTCLSYTQHRPQSMAAAEAAAEDGAATGGRGGGQQRRGGRRAQRRGAGRGRAPLCGGPVPAAGAAGGHGCGVHACQRALLDKLQCKGAFHYGVPYCEVSGAARKSPDSVHGWQRSAISGMCGS